MGEIRVVHAVRTMGTLIEHRMARPRKVMNELLFKARSRVITTNV